MIYKRCKNNNYDFYQHQVVGLMRVGFDFYHSKMKPTQKMAHEYIINKLLVSVLNDIDGNIMSIEIKYELMPTFYQFETYLKKEKLFRKEARRRLRASN